MTKPSPARWLVLFAFSYNSAWNAFMYMDFAAVSDVSRDVMELDETQLNMLYSASLFAVLPTAIIAARGLEAHDRCACCVRHICVALESSSSPPRRSISPAHPPSPPNTPFPSALPTLRARRTPTAPPTRAPPSHQADSPFGLLAPPPDARAPTRLTSGLGVLANVAGAWLRLLAVARRSYPLALLSSITIGLSSAVLICSYSRIAARHFPPRERTLATTLGVQARRPCALSRLETMTRAMHPPSPPPHARPPTPVQ
jgi:hypothetical protein